MRSLSHKVLVGIATAATAIAVAGCGGTSMDEATISESNVPHEVGLASRETGDGEWAASEDIGAAVEEAGTDQSSKIAVSGYAEVIAKDPLESARTFKESVLAAGGRIDSEWSQNDPDYLSATVSARIPAEKYAEITATLSTLGRVQTLSTSADDLSQQYIDFDARRAALEDSIERVKTLADDASSTQELLQAEELLTQQQSELDSMVQQLEWIDRQVEMSSLNVSFSTEQVGSPQGPLSWVWMVNLLTESLHVLLTLVVFLLPWAVIGIPLVVLLRKWFRSRRAKKLRTEAPVPAGDEPLNSEAGEK